MKLCLRQIREKILKEINIILTAATKRVIINMANKCIKNLVDKMIKEMQNQTHTTISNVFDVEKKGHIKSQCREFYDKKENEYACSLNVNQLKLKEFWILDSGASSHMVNNKEYFETITETKQKLY